MTALDQIAEDGLPRRYRLAWAAVWLVFLGYPIGDILSKHHSTGWLFAAWASLAVFVALYLRTMWLGLSSDLQPEPAAAVWLVVLIVATFAMVGAFGPAWGGLIIYLGVATGFSLSNRPALLTLGAIAIVTVVIGVAVGVSTSNLAFVVFLTSALGVTMLGVRRLFQLIVELHFARDHVARLAAAEQQSRFARDLHDVLGHNLSVIALKSQVARRIMRADPDAAEAAIVDAEAVARQSLQDVRELVSGYRQRSLDQELAAAEELLIAADIEPAITRPDVLPDGRPGELLAWALREGTTNVIRHSQATHCRITVSVADERTRLQIEDDGMGTEVTGSGSGIRGLRERLDEAGGCVEAGLMAEGGFRLSVEVPR
jgi:two-component system sensor histidine kinase DesK